MQDLAGKPVDTLVWKSPEGIPVKPIYTAEDVKVRGRHHHRRRHLPLVALTRLQVCACVPAG
ncbi:hypothetical protein EON67_12085, partial [archaeon]